MNQLLTFVFVEETLPASHFVVSCIILAWLLLMRAAVLVGLWYYGYKEWRSMIRFNRTPTVSEIKKSI